MVLRISVHCCCSSWSLLLLAFFCWCFFHAFFLSSIADATFSFHHGTSTDLRPLGTAFLAAVRIPVTKMSFSLFMHTSSVLCLRRHVSSSFLNLLQSALLRDHLRRLGTPLTFVVSTLVVRTWWSDVGKSSTFQELRSTHLRGTAVISIAEGVPSFLGSHLVIDPSLITVQLLDIKKSSRTDIGIVFAIFGSFQEHFMFTSPNSMLSVSMSLSHSVSVPSQWGAQYKFVIVRSPLAVLMVTLQFCIISLVVDDVVVMFHKISFRTYIIVPPHPSCRTARAAAVDWAIDGVFALGFKCDS